MGKGQERGKAEKARLVLFVKKGLDSLIDEVIAALFGHFETKKVVVSSAGQIDAGMKWADVCWFEWCDELVAYASRHPLAAQKKIVCRLHGFETFTQYPAKVDWEAVDLTICVAPHIRDHLTEKTNVDPEKTAIIPIAVDTDRYSFRKRAPGPKLAWAGYINYKKGPMLLLHTFKAMHDADSKCELHIAGVFQDERDLIYFRQMSGEWGIEDSVFFEGWQEDLDDWLEDKDFILCTSLTESQNLTVMQAMAKGIKPIIHNFVGAREISGTLFSAAYRKRWPCSPGLTPKRTGNISVALRQGNNGALSWTRCAASPGSGPEDAAGQRGRVAVYST